MFNDSTTVFVVLAVENAATDDDDDDTYLPPLIDVADDDDDNLPRWYVYVDGISDYLLSIVPDELRDNDWKKRKAEDTIILIDSVK